MEEWKQYDKNYDVSSEGRIRNRHTGKIKAVRESKHGYFYISHSIGNKLTTKAVHRMVAKAFIPNPNNLREVDHINCNKHDNRAVNLEWVSSSENKLRAIENGLYDNNAKHWFGKRKPIIAKSLETGKETKYISLNQAEKVYGKHIVDVLKGRRKQTHEHIFFYEGSDA